MSKATKVYGVSTGNGNNGVSQLFPNYYVRTNDPWRLAKLAILAEFQPVARQWVKDNTEIDGDEDYTISAVILNPPCGDNPPTFDYPEVDDEEEADDGRNYSDGNGAWLILEVFPVEEEDIRSNALMWGSLIKAFGLGRKRERKRIARGE